MSLKVLRVEEYQKVLSLLEYVKVNRYYVSCHFKCSLTHKKVIATLPFEPYDGKIVLKWYEVLFRPFESYKRYYHTPIVIYDDKSEHTIVLKAFEKVKNNFVWYPLQQRYVYKK